MPDIIRLYGQFPAEPPVYQHQQFYTPWPAKVYQRVHGRADSPAGMQHVVYQNHIPAFNTEFYIRVPGHMYALVDVVPVEGNIQLAVFYLLLFGYFLYQCRYTVAEEYPPGLYSYYCCIAEIEMIFYQLVRQPLQCYIQLIMIEQSLQILRCFRQK